MDAQLALEGNTQAVATRDDSPTDAAFMYWDSATNSIKNLSTFYKSGSGILNTGSYFYSLTTQTNTISTTNTSTNLKLQTSGDTYALTFWNGSNESLVITSGSTYIKNDIGVAP